MISLISGLDVALAIGVAVCVLNLTDLLLNRDQKAWISSSMETLTLRLEYTRPLSWLTSLDKVPLPHVLYGSFGYLVLWCFLGPGNRVAIATAVFALTLAMYLLPPFAIWEFAKPVLREFGDFVSPRSFFRTIGRLLWQYLKSLIPTILVAAPLTLVSSEIFREADAFLGTGNIAWIGNIVWIIVFNVIRRDFIFVTVVFPVTFIVALAACVLLTLHTAIAISRSLCWRIVEFQKGAVAAATTIMTTVLTIIKLMVAG